MGSGVVDDLGKGARNRQQRQRAAQEQGLSEEHLDMLFSLSSASDLVRLLRERPELSGERVERELRELARHEAYGAPFALFRRLLAAARTDPDNAWDEYERARREVDRRSEDLGRLVEQIAEAKERNDHEAVIELAPQAAEQAQVLGLGLAAAEAHEALGMALFRRSSGSRADELEAAISALEAAVQLSPRGEEAAGFWMHLGLVQAERVRGDSAENLDRAIVCQRTALEQLESSEDHELRAMVQTNLAVALLRVAGTNRETLSEAVSLCEAALGFRSPERDAVNWAYTQLNLAEALGDLAAVGEVDEVHAREAFERVLEEQERIGERWLIGAAHHGLGRGFLRSASMTADQMLEAHEREEPLFIEREGEYLRAAREHLTAARPLVQQADDRLRYGYLLDDLSDALNRLEEKEAAIAACRDALEILRPTVAPRASTSVGGRLGDLLTERGEWGDAARAFREAVEAADFAFHGQLDTASRRAQTLRTGNLARWAAYAIARSGDVVGAAVVLENGRARELGRRLGVEGLEQERLGRLPRRLRQSLVQASRQLMRASAGSAGARAGREYQEVVATIREIPGFEDFLASASPEDVFAAVVNRPGWRGEFWPWRIKDGVHAPGAHSRQADDASVFG